MRPLHFERLEVRRPLAADVVLEILNLPSQTHPNEEVEFDVLVSNVGDVAVESVTELPLDGLLTNAQWQRRTRDRRALEDQQPLLVNVEYMHPGGDINGDGIQDFIGAGQNSTRYVFYGSSEFDGRIETRNLNGINGFRLSPQLDPYDGSVSPIGDINGDQMDDLFFYSPEKAYTLRSK